MGIRAWVTGLLDRGDAPPADPDELVEVDLAPTVEGPLRVAALRAEGIDATTVDAFDPVTAVTRTRLLVRRADAPAAAAVLARPRWPLARAR